MVYLSDPLIATLIRCTTGAIIRTAIANIITGEPSAVLWHSLAGKCCLTLQKWSDKLGRYAINARITDAMSTEDRALHAGPA